MSRLTPARLLRKRPSLAALGAIMALALVASACGSSSKSSSASSKCKADKFGCVVYAAGQPINFGTLLAISGDNANLGTDSQHGVQLALDYLDGNFDGTLGTVLGHPVKTTNEDDGCSKEGGQAGATKLVADPTIVAVIGTTCSSAALGVADKIFSDKGILLISPSATNPNLTASASHQPYFLRTAYNDRIQGAVVSDFAYNFLHTKSAATIHDESPYSDALAAVFRDDFQKLGGTITASEAISSKDTDFKPLLGTIGQGKPDFLYFPDFNPACALIVKQAVGIAGLSASKLVGSDGCFDPTYTQIAGPAANGTYDSGPDVSGLKNTSAFYANQLLTAYQKQFGTLPTAPYHPYAYDATNILIEAIKKVAISSGGTLSIPRTALRDALFATANYPGVTGTVNCNANGDCGSPVTIGVYQWPNVPVVNKNATAVFKETKTLADVGGSG
jgi:branched-chain amino acid transport system substrate-binding protein